MQISQSQNQTSFGINSIKFASPVAKDAFEKATKKIPKEKLSAILQEIKGLKPKHGPDVDAFIETYSAGGSGVYLNARIYEGKNNVEDIGTAFSSIFKDKSTVTPKTLMKAFKNLINNVDNKRLNK